MKKLFLFLALFFVFVSSFFIIPSASALTTQDITSRFSSFLASEITLPHPAYVNIPSGHERVAVWLIIATFAMLFSILYALTIKLSIFKKDDGAVHKGMATVFAASMSFIVIFASAFCEWVAKLAGNLAQIAAIMMFLLAIILMWYYSASAYHTGKKAMMDSAVGSSTSKTALAAAQTTEHQAKHDLDIVQEKLHKEKRDLNIAKHNLHNLQIDTRDEIKALKQIQKIVTHLNSVETAEAVKLKQMYQRQLAVLATLIQHEHKDLNEYKSRINRINNLGHAMLRAAHGEDVAVKKLELVNERLRHLGISPPLDLRQTIRAEQISNNAIYLNKEHNKLTKNISEELKNVETLDQQTISSIHGVIAALHGDNYPQALHHINTAIGIKTKINGMINNARHHDIDLGRLEAKQSSLDKELTRFFENGT